MNEGIHLDLDTWIVPGQIRKANLINRQYSTPHLQNQKGGSSKSSYSNEAATLRWPSPEDTLEQKCCLTEGNNADMLADCYSDPNNGKRTPLHTMQLLTLLFRPLSDPHSKTCSRTQNPNSA